MIRSYERVVDANVLPAEQESIFNFFDDLQMALQNAPLHHATTSNKWSFEEYNEALEETKPFANLSDATIVLIDPPKHAANEVVTLNPTAYPHLIEQALKVALGASTSQDPVHLSVSQEKVDQIVQHEGKHVGALSSISSFLKVYYAVGIVRLLQTSGEISTYIAPSVTCTGYMRKIDLAYILAQPSMLSESDVKKINLLGYDSREQIIEIHKGLPSRKIMLGCMNLLGKLGI